MFNNSVKSVLAAFALSAGATFAVPASAGNFDLHIGSGNGGIYLGGGERHKYKPYNGNGFTHHHYKKRVKHKGNCGPRRALRKAWHMGVNQPHIARLNKRKVVVVGYNRGHAAKVVFKRNSHRCKVIKARGLY